MTDLQTTIDGLDRRHWINSVRVILSLGLLLFLLIAGTFLRGYNLYLLTEILILAIFAYGFSLLFSHAGYLSFGHAAFYAAGAYTVALMFEHVTESTWLAFLAAQIATGIMASVIGFLSVRLGVRIYFALLTLAFAQMVYAVVFRSGFTGGDDGIPGVIARPLDFGVFEVKLASTVNYYYFTLVLFLVCVFVTWRIVNSPFGYTLRSIRDNSERAAFVGINVRWHAWIAFVISALFAGLSGALFVCLSKIAAPELAHWLSGGEVIIACLMGGLYTFSGPFVGAAIFVLLKSQLMAVAGNWPLFMGPILLLFVLFFRSGITGFFSERLNTGL